MSGKEPLKEFLQEMGAHFWVRSFRNGGAVVIVHCGCDYHPSGQLEEVEYTKEICCDDENCGHASVWPCSHINRSILPAVNTMEDVFGSTPRSGDCPF